MIGRQKGIDGTRAGESSSQSSGIHEIGRKSFRAENLESRETLLAAAHDSHFLAPIQESFGDDTSSISRGSQYHVHVSSCSSLDLRCGAERGRYSLRHGDFDAG